MACAPVEIDIPVPWGVLKGKWWGPKSEEPIIFLHGWQDNMGSFNRLIPLLPPGLPYLCLEFPGHGMSSPIPEGQFYYLFWDGLILLRRVVKHFGWKKISIVGHSLGGGVGFLYAAAYPDQVDKLVSLDIACPRVNKPSTLVHQTSTAIDKFLEYEEMREDQQPCYLMKEMVDIALDGYRGSLTREAVEVMLERGTKQAPHRPSSRLFTRDLRLKVAGLAMPCLPVVLEYASRIECHYMNIRAKDGLVGECPEVYPMVLDRIKQRAKTFHYHEVEGTHHVHLNDPTKVAPLISRFLQPQANHFH